MATEQGWFLPRAVQFADGTKCRRILKRAIVAWREVAWRGL